MPARLLLGTGALLLLAAAAFHGTGLSMVGGWFTDERAGVMKMLWLTPTIDWSIVALLWAYVAIKQVSALRGIAIAAALLPVASAVGLVAAVGPRHPGPWMLVGSAILAAIGAARLKSTS